MNIDVRKAIEKNSYVTSVADLEKTGRRKVKVIKTSTIRELINQAVENVRRSGEPGGSKDQMVAQTSGEFNRLLKDHQQDQQSISKLEETNQAYKALITDLNARIKHQEELLEQAKSQQREAADTSVMEARVAELERDLKTETEAVEAARAKLDEKNARIEGLTADAARAKELEAELALAKQVAEAKSTELGEFEAAAARTAELETELETLRESTGRAERLEAELTDLRAAAAEAESLESALKQAKREIVRVRELEEELATAKRKLEAGKTELDGLRVDVKRIAELEADLADSVKHIEQLKAMNEELEAKHGAVSEQAERFERDSSEQIHRMNEVLLRQEKELETARAAVAEGEENKLKVASLSAELSALRESQPATTSLLEELKQMREEVKQLEARNRDLEAQAATAPAASADTTNLEAMLENKMSQISSELSMKLANLKHGSDAGTEPEDIKSAIQQIFSHDLDADVDSNLGEVEVKQRKSAGIAGNLERLKNLGRKKDQ